MKITVNLATRPFADQGPILKRLRIAMAVFAVVSIGLGFGLHLLHAKAEVARARMQTLDNQIGGINHERQGYQVMMRQPVNAQVLQQSGNLNALFDQKAFSWTLAMEDLETVLPAGVQVTTLEPVRDEKTGQITLKLRVVGPRDKGLELVQNLEHSHHFLHPAIVGESLENNGGPNNQLEPVSASNRVNFDLNADYNSATIGELPKKPEEAKKTERAALGATSASGTTAARPAHASGVPAAGPGLRRPPLTGMSRPPAAAQPAPTGKSPYVAHPSTAGRPAGGPPSLQPNANPQQKPAPGRSQQPGRNQQPVRPGGPQ
jgi:type IV pilus assembly protein PilN